jgi:hypothetical protein
MAENINALILPIGADATQFERSINDVKSAFKELSATIAATPFNLVTDKQKLQLNALKETLTVLTTDVKTFGQAVKIPENSILGLTQRIAELNKKKISLDAKTSASEIARLTKEIEKLTAKKNNIDALGASVNKLGSSAGSGLKKTEDASKNATRALTSLSLVAQDAPFGFIGIQNNLPAVIQTFTELSAGSKGLKGALSQIGSALVGPAGLFLAFSVVTAAVTFAIKEYGSLSNAVNVLFGANANAVKSQNDFNKEIVESAKNSAGQVAKINILVATIQNENTSQKDRIAAYRELKRINPDVVAGIDEQNLSTLKSIKLVGENAKAQLEFIKLQTKIAGITKALGGLEEERFQANGKYNVERKKELDLINFIAKAKEKRKNKQDLSTLEINTLASENIQLKAQAKNVKEASDAIADITEKQKNWTNSLTPAITSISKISSNAQDLTDDLDKLRKSQEEARKTAGKNQFTLGIDPQELDAAFNLDKIISSIIKYGNALLDTNKSVEERKNALKELVAINPQVFSGLSLEKSATLANKESIENYIRSLEALKKEREFSARASQINAEFLKAEIKSQDAAAKAEEDRLDGLLKIAAAEDEIFSAKLLKRSYEFFVQLGKIQEINQGIIDILTKGLGVENTYEKAIKDLLNFEAYQKASIERISRNFRFLQNPLEDLFGSVLEDGIANWQAFGDAVVAEIKKIVAALIAKGVIQLLASLLAPGVGSLIGGGGAALGQDAFERYFKIFDFNPQGSKVNFSGVQGGGMQMAGAVNLTLRGSDLVGSINRTNSTINRVG